MRRRFFCVGLISILLASFLQQFVVAADPHVVEMSFSTGFTPSDLQILPGETVIFRRVNDTHTVTGTGSDPFCGDILINSSNPECVRTFSSVGTNYYKCQFHGNMTGVIRVVASTVPNVLPTISIDSPAAGETVNIYPTNIFRATATDTDGSIARVEFFYRPDQLAGAISLGVVTNTVATNTSFSLLVTNIFPLTNNLVLLAKATDDRGGESAYSQLLFNAGFVLLNPTNNAGQFEFVLPSTNGLRYVVESSVNLTNWTTVVSGTSSGNKIIFNDPSAGSPSSLLRFYRVKLSP